MFSRHPTLVAGARERVSLHSTQEACKGKNKNPSKQSSKAIIEFARAGEFNNSFLGGRPNLHFDRG
jgi:hypothetical protein